MILGRVQEKTLQDSGSKARDSEQKPGFEDSPTQEDASPEPKRAGASTSKEPSGEPDLEKTLIQKPGSGENKDS